MNPLLLLSLLQGGKDNAIGQALGTLMGGVAASASPTQSGSGLPAAPASAGADLAAALALMQAVAARPAPSATAPEARLPRAAAIVATIVVIGFFVILVAIACLLIFARGLDGAPLAALAVLCVGFGVLSSKFGTVVDFLFGSSWGSRTKDARIVQDGAGAPVVLPTTLPAPTPSEPDGGGAGQAEPVEPGADNFARVHAVIGRWEGGYSDHPQDRGGPTNFGITQGVLAEWRGRPVTAADVKALSYAEAIEIFRARYWKPLRCDDLQIAVALMTYNAGVNSGISRGAKFLQECLNKQGAGLDVDGEVGPLTLAAAGKADVARLIDDYAARYEAYYRSLATFPTFGRGWLNRLKDVTATANKWAGEPAPKVPEPPVHPKILSTAQVKAAFGDFSYTEAHGGRVTIDRDWVAANIAEVEIPQLAAVGVKTLQFHRKAVDALRAAFADIEAAGLVDRIVTFDGTWVARHMTWNASRPLSRHSWGIAIDLNAAWNAYGSTGAPAGAHGSVVEIVPIFERHGFAWGGLWSSAKDPMHFEYAVAA